ncbi:MAG: TonB-dependent receptor, partial [Thermoanaerobaculia bacterium]|nr:TonB-dependent receptor [Thermoanaerobaculia bacterium]
MARRRRSVAFVLCSVILALAPHALSQTTSSIVGRVADEAGAPLPGASVEASSPSLQGTATALTDTQGRYRLTLLPPGVYAVTFTLQGFAKERQANVAVALGRDTSLNADLHLATKVQTSVTSEASAIELTSSGVGTGLDQRAVTTLPSGRNYSSVAQVVPGVSSDANPANPDQDTITVYGSSGAENAFYIDGVNTTGAEYGFQGKELNFEFIQAVDVKTGGYEAEFGRSTGGIVSVITKSGGNEFHGDVFGYYDSDKELVGSFSLQASADPVVSNTTSAGYTRKDFGLGLGGFMIKDRLWFFGAYDRVDNSQDSTLPDGPRAGQVATSKSARDLASGKLTFKLAQSQTVTGTVFLDPRDDTGAIND